MARKNRRLLCFMLAVFTVIFLFSALPAFADSNGVTYEIEELSMTLDVPQNVKIVTSAVKQNDPIFRENNLDYIQTMSKIRENNDYLYGKDFSSGIDFEVMAQENQNGISNLSKLSEKKLDALTDDISAEDDVFLASVYDSGKYKFVEIFRNFTDSTGRKFCKEYYTVYNETDIALRIVSENENFSESEIEMIKSIVNSVRFPEDRKFTLKGKLSAATVVPFVVISVCFVILVYKKIQDINKENFRAERRKSREESEKQAEKKPSPKPELIQEAEITEVVPERQETSPQPPETKTENNGEAADVKTEVIESQPSEEDPQKESVSEEEPRNVVSGSNNETETKKNEAEKSGESDEDKDVDSEAAETSYGIDLDAAIANFEVTPERRRERRERFKEKNQKRKTRKK